MDTNGVTDNSLNDFGVCHAEKRVVVRHGGGGGSSGEGRASGETDEEVSRHGLD